MAENTEQKAAILLAYIERLQQYTGRPLHLTASDVASLAHIMMQRTYRRRSPMARAGENEQYLHFMVKGLARQYFYDGNEEVTIYLAKEGDLMSSFVSYFSGAPSETMIETLEPTITMAIPRMKLEQLLPYSSRVNRFARLVLSEQILQMENWELTLLRYNIRERFMMFIRNNPDLYTRVPYKIQASFLDIKPETFSRLKAQLERKVKAIHGK